jgi:Toprim-like
MYNLPSDFSAFGYHLRSRGLMPWHRCWVDPATEVVTFPLWSIEAIASQNRRLIGYQRYDWRGEKLRDNGGKYFTYANEHFKDRAAYGIENCYGYGPLFLVEGIWDSLSVVNCYFDCIACLGCSPSKNLKAHLRQLAGNRPLVGLLDHDENRAGNRLASSCDLWYYPPEGYKDVNSMPYNICFDWLTNVRNMVQLK